MDDRKWKVFFDLLEDVVKMPFATWQERRDKIKERATWCGQTDALDEFVGLFEE